MNHELIPPQVSSQPQIWCQIGVKVCRVGRFLLVLQNSNHFAVNNLVERDWPRSVDEFEEN
jgi:hypothetical protein